MYMSLSRLSYDRINDNGGYDGRYGSPRNMGLVFERFAQFLELGSD